MAKKEAYTEIERKLEIFNKLWVVRYCLEHYEPDYAYLNTYADGDGGGQDFLTSAICESRWQYMQFKIKYYLPSLARHDDETLYKISCHEHAHVSLGPEQSLIDARFVGDSARERFTEAEHSLLIDRNYELLENSTEMITKAMLRAYPYEKNV
jgi:hypothetical protein